MIADAGLRAVPLPSTLVLLGLCLVGLIGLRRKAVRVCERLRLTLESTLALRSKLERPPGFAQAGVFLQHP